MKSPPPKTPEGSPSKRPMLLTQRQKQALIDNLQLEITERARKLRAQYTSQAHHLRTRIELRVNRVPTALRKVKMGELLEKYAEKEREKRDSDPPLATNAPQKHATAIESPKTTAGKGSGKESTLAQQPRTRGTKRDSASMLGNDKENLPDNNEPLPNPKKRVKAMAKATVTTKPSSRQITNPHTVLSPKSSNSCTLPASPLRSQYKSMLPRPESPLKKAQNVLVASPTKYVPAATETAPKPAIIIPADKPKPTKASAAKRTVKQVNDVKAALGRPKRGVGAASKAGNRTVSSSTNASTGTIITKPVKKLATKTETKKSAAAKKAPAAKTEVPPTGGRVLRKRV